MLLLLGSPYSGSARPYYLDHRGRLWMHYGEMLGWIDTTQLPYTDDQLATYSLRHVHKALKTVFIQDKLKE